MDEDVGEGMAVLRAGFDDLGMEEFWGIGDVVPRTSLELMKKVRVEHSYTGPIQCPK